MLRKKMSIKNRYKQTFCSLRFIFFFFWQQIVNSNQIQFVLFTQMIFCPQNLNEFDGCILNQTNHRMIFEKPTTNTQTTDNIYWLNSLQKLHNQSLLSFFYRRHVECLQMFLWFSWRFVDKITTTSTVICACVCVCVCCELN